MEVLADARAFGHRFDESIRQIPGMRGDEAQARDRRPVVGAANAVDRAQQLGQVGSPVQVQLAPAGSLGVDVAEPPLSRQVVAVAVDVLAEQRQLPIPRRRDRPRLGDDVVEGTTALGPTRERDDAIGAGLVAETTVVAAVAAVRRPMGA